MQPLMLPNQPWVVPAFYNEERDPFFEAAVRSAAAAQGIEVPPEALPFKRKKGEPALVVQEDPRITSIREQLYGFAMYHTQFSMPVTCKGNQFSARFVPGHLWGGPTAGPTKAKVAVIGKMPGREEVNKGRNFLGASGVLLRDQLAMMGVDARDWYVTNLVKFAPPEEFSGALPASWVSMCLPILLAELAIVQPDYILCLGSEASKALLKVTVDKAYGTSFEYTYRLDPQGLAQKTARATVSIHPAAIVRKAERINQLQLSLRQFREMVAGKEPDLVEQDLHHFVIRSQPELKALVDSILSVGCPMVAIDAEWYGRREAEPGAFLRCYQFSWAPKHAAVVSLTDTAGNPVFQGDPYADFARLFTQQPTVRLVGHNLKGDVLWLKDKMKPHGVDFEELMLPVQSGDINGPSDTRYLGGFDTMLAMHSIKETGPYELESLAVLFLGVPRYDRLVQSWLDKDVPHGKQPDEVLYPYAAYDSDVTLRLAMLFNGQWNGPAPADCVRPGLLDADPQFGLNGRPHFFIKMLASPSFMEMEETGLVFDTVGCNAMRQDFIEAKEALLAELRAEINWPDFNPNSLTQKRELLFGEHLNGRKVPEGQSARVRPDGAACLGLTPLKTTGKPPKTWARVVLDNQTHLYTPSMAKDTLGVYAHVNKTVGKIMDLSFLNQPLITVLREASEQSLMGLVSAKAVPEADDDDDESEARPRGWMDFVCSDMTVKPIFFQTKETGRASASKPNPMAMAKRRDKDYKRLLKGKFRPLRSLIVARPGYVLIESDFIGAELAAMAWLCGSKLMMDHVRRSGLPESHPDHYDIHSNFAVEIFRLGIEPKKSVLDAAGKRAYRDAVKTIVFGIPYGRGLEAVIMAVKEESGIELSLPEATAIRDGIFAKYPELYAFLEKSKERAVRPGWLREPNGGLRRFQVMADDNKSVEDAKREACNCRIQGCVASAMSKGLYYIRAYRRNLFQHLDYRLINTVHDAALLHCAVKDVEEVTTKVLPICLGAAIAFKPVDDDGRLINDMVCKFDIETHVYEKWGLDLTHDDCDRLGLDRKYGKAPKQKAA